MTYPHLITYGRQHRAGCTQQVSLVFHSYWRPYSMEISFTFSLRCYNQHRTCCWSSFGPYLLTACHSVSWQLSCAAIFLLREGLSSSNMSSYLLQDLLRNCWFLGDYGHNLIAFHLHGPQEYRVRFGSDSTVSLSKVCTVHKAPFSAALSNVENETETNLKDMSCLYFMRLMNSQAT